MGLGLTFEEFHWELLIVPVCKELGGILFKGILAAPPQSYPPPEIRA